MKKVLIGSALAASLLFAGANQSLAATSQFTEISIHNISSMDIETVLMMVQSERTKLLDAQLQSQIAEVQKRNEQVAILNEQLEILNEQLNVARASNSINDITEIETQITSIRQQIFTIGDSQQMDKRRLQSYSDKHKLPLELTTNYVKKMQASRAAIIGNMR
ncbi:hypothetical protein [Metabacillus malikii]|uniref:TolA-binding protein n=1 Tax=Metabacillus malikii TaxID=1504265 RepID=A0ABT9ZJM2_9BACI|nr:hypothetical protein [Metabacillus malikii]MDQ0231997.1 TolA-binding protein [Metabacillus malikii]